MTFQVITKSFIKDTVFIIAEHLLRLLFTTILPALSDK